jgi:DMSO/TMAO reductase YedYZ molybdopterin-dependent catalytic subunit
MPSSLPRHPIVDTQAQATRQATLVVDGLVAQPRRLGPADLAALPRATLTVAFTCEEGWSVPGLRWGGVRLLDVLALAQPRSEARYVRAGAGPFVVPLSLDEAAQALVTDRLNDQPLSVEHGAPWRLVVPGGVCYSSVKWLARLELTAEPGEHDARRIALARVQPREQ